MNIQHKNLKKIDFKLSGRSSDYIFPTILSGCFGDCLYCYAARHAPNNFYNEIKISENIDEIISKVENYKPDVIKPNQTHSEYVTWDIACNSDIVPALHLFDWEKLFDYFKYSNRDFGTFATKFVNPRLLEYNPNKKIRVRMTLTTFPINKYLEKNTASIKKRVKFINQLYNAGYEVHVNFSPVVYYKGWIKDYEQLFDFINESCSEEVKSQLKCEVIFLTHNESLHKYNLENSKEYESVLWTPDIQENKVSKFGGNNIRYKHGVKNVFINMFKELIAQKMPYCDIRYIF
jgi:DNA repair photolyase